MPDLDYITIPFGKHYGTPLSEMDPGYLDWMLKVANGADESTPLSRFVDEYRDEIKEAQHLHVKRVAEQALETKNYTLSDSQRLSVDTLLDWLVDETGDSWARLDGGAGYGKSFTVIDLVLRAQVAGYYVCAAATSYVATQVLKRQLDDYGVPCNTIASTLRLEKVYEGREEKYMPSEKTYEALITLLGKNRLLIIDEWSMVNDEIGDLLMKYATRCGGRLLCVGDAEQLPPVKQDHDSVLQTIPFVIELTEPMRYSKDSALYLIEQSARQDPFRVVEKCKAVAQTGCSEITVYNNNHAMAEAYVEQYLDNPEDTLRMLFFLRLDVVSANHWVRKHLFGDDASNIVNEDEQIMVMATNDIPMGFPGSDDSNRFYSGTTYRVVKRDDAIIENVPCTIATFDNNTRAPVIFALNENSADPDMPGSPEYTARLRELALHARQDEDNGMSRQMAWLKYHEFKRQFLLVGYTYATSIHRAQGATLDQVFVVPRQLMRFDRYLARKLIYVAMTRAKKHLHVVL